MTAHYLGIRMNEAILAALSLDEQKEWRIRKMHEYFRKYALRADSLLEETPHLETVALVIICPVSRNFSGEKNRV